MLDASVTQKQQELSLVIVVRNGTSGERSRELGDNFVRLVKTFGPEPNPEVKIGTGTFDYLIGVYFPDQTQVALGAKASSSPQITW